MLDFHDNPAKIFGMGISANVLDVLIGAIMGSVVISRMLKKSLTNLMDNHGYLRVFLVV